MAPKKTPIIESDVSYVDTKLIPDWFNQERCRSLTQMSTKPVKTGGVDSCVIYWMGRDMRVDDNWALLFAHHLAKTYLDGCSLKVVYAVPTNWENRYTKRHFDFLIGGLKLVEEELCNKGVNFDVIMGDPIETISKYVKTNEAVALVTDMSPLRERLQWATGVAKKLDKLTSPIPLFQVDTHNIVPVWFASPKKEVGARTLRPKIHANLKSFLTDFPEFSGQAKQGGAATAIKPVVVWKQGEDYIEKHSNEDPTNLPALKWASPGTKKGMEVFKTFCTSKLKRFADSRNDPNKSVSSNMAPWFNFGHVAAQRVFKEVQKPEWRSASDGVAAFVEEGVVRRELSDNYCYYNPKYDSVEGAADWVKETLKTHEVDKRDYIYTLSEFEESKTHDPLWNAAQTQLVMEGKMHGFLRMYWAKKILEWTKNAQDAYEYGLSLNDRFSLDGNDPNGFVGVGWSIIGVHDMGWTERPVFGKIRFMNYAGCKRKFDVQLFESKYSKAQMKILPQSSKKRVSQTEEGEAQSSELPKKSKKKA